MSRRGTTSTASKHPKLDFLPRTVRAGAIAHDLYIGPNHGPGVLLLHEIKGLSENTFELAELITAEGFTVGLPHLFGRVSRDRVTAESHATFGGCIAREMSLLAGRTPRAGTEWLAAAASELACAPTSTSPRGVGVIGMCATGAFAMGAVFDRAVGAVVASQATSPYLQPGSWAVDGGDEQLGATTTPVMALRFEHDVVAARRRVRHLPHLLGESLSGPSRVDGSGQRSGPTNGRGITVEAGDRLHLVWADGWGHSVLNFARVDVAVRAVVDFLAANLKEPAANG